MGRTSHSSGLMVGLAAGLFVGVALAFLYAPRPGKETSEMVREKMEAVGNKAAEVVYQAVDCLTERVKGMPDYSSAGDL